MDKIIVAVDIGTSKICTMIGSLNKEDQLEILGKGWAFCNGIKKGVIVDIESVSSSIRASVKQAESMANLKVSSAYTCISGMHVNVINNSSTIDISGENREITNEDIERVLYAVKDVPIAENSQIIDIIPRQYIIDGYDEILDPVGMVGVKLEVEADIVIGKITSVQSIIKSLEKAGLRVDGIIAGAFAAGEIALTPDEKEMGVILIDVGAGLTDVAVFNKKKLVFYNSIPVGGDHITNDISIGLKIPFREAEKIKREYELALTSLIANDQEIFVSDMNNNRKKHVKISQVVEIIEARVSEIFFLSHNLLLKSGINGIFNSGVVLTGGGISYVDGCKQLAGEVFDLPVRVASFGPANVKPEHAIAAGIIRHVAGVYKSGRGGSEVSASKQADSKRSGGLLNKLSKLFKDFF